MTKEALLSYKYRRKELQSIERQIAQLRADARSIKGINYDSSPRSNGAFVPAQQRYIERMDKLLALYTDKKAQLVASQITIEQTLALLPPELGTLMRYRYIDGLRWEDVNDKLNISASTSKRLHKKALSLLSLTNN